MESDKENEMSDVETWEEKVEETGEERGVTSDEMADAFWEQYLKGAAEDKAFNMAQHMKQYHPHGFTENSTCKYLPNLNKVLKKSEEVKTSSGKSVPYYSEAFDGISYGRAKEWLSDEIGVETVRAESLESLSMIDFAPADYAIFARDGEPITQEMHERVTKVLYCVCKDLKERFPTFRLAMPLFVPWNFQKVDGGGASSPDRRRSKEFERLCDELLISKNDLNARRRECYLSLGTTDTEGWSSPYYHTKENFIFDVMRHEIGHNLATRQVYDEWQALYERVTKKTAIHLGAPEESKSVRDAVKGFIAAKLNPAVVDSPDEIIAEIFSIYTSPDYEEGSLPRQMERIAGLMLIQYDGKSIEEMMTMDSKEKEKKVDLPESLVKASVYLTNFDPIPLKPKGDKICWWDKAIGKWRTYDSYTAMAKDAFSKFGIDKPFIEEVVSGLQGIEWDTGLLYEVWGLWGERKSAKDIIAKYKNYFSKPKYVREEDSFNPFAEEDAPVVEDSAEEVKDIVIFDPEEFDQNSFEWGAIYWINTIRGEVEKFDDGYVIPDEQMIEMLAPLKAAARVYAEAQGQNKAWVKNTVLSVPKAFLNAFDVLSDGEGVTKERFLELFTVEAICALATGEVNSIHDIEEYYDRKGIYKPRGGYKVGDWVVIEKNAPGGKEDKRRDRDIRRVIALLGDEGNGDVELVFWNAKKTKPIARKASDCSEAFSSYEAASDYKWDDVTTPDEDAESRQKSEEDEVYEALYGAILESMGITQDAMMPSTAGFWQKHCHQYHPKGFSEKTTCKYLEGVQCNGAQVKKDTQKEDDTIPHIGYVEGAEEITALHNIPKDSRRPYALNCIKDRWEFFDTEKERDAWVKEHEKECSKYTMEDARAWMEAQLPKIKAHIRGKNKSKPSTPPEPKKEKGEKRYQDIVADAIEAACGITQDAASEKGAAGFWEEHDRKHHHGHYDPETQTCTLREEARAAEERRSKTDAKIDDLTGGSGNAIISPNKTISKEEDYVRAQGNNLPRREGGEGVGREQPQGGGAHNILAESSAIARGVEGRVQESTRVRDKEAESAARLKEYAKENGLWRDDVEKVFDARYGTEEGQKNTDGGEAIVWFDRDRGVAVKAIGLDYYGSPALALDRVELHNRYFPHAPLSLVGFGEVKDVVGKDGEVELYGRPFNLIAEQSIIDRSKELTKDEIRERLEAQGFMFVADRGDSGIDMATPDGKAVVSDLHERNVFGTEGGGVAVIDCDIRRKGGLAGENNPTKRNVGVTDEEEAEYLEAVLSGDETKTTQLIQRAAKLAGYEDVSEYKNTENTRKLLDPVTYDDKGRVIPLSKRFDDGDDIRGDVTGGVDIMRLREYKDLMEKKMPGADAMKALVKIGRMKDPEAMEKAFREMMERGSIAQDALDPNDPDFWMKHDRARHGGHFDPETQTCTLREQMGLPTAKNKTQRETQQAREDEQIDDLSETSPKSNPPSSRTQAKINELANSIASFGGDMDPVKLATLISALPKASRIVKAAQKIKSLSSPKVRRVSAEEFHKAISAAVATRPESDRWRVDIHPIEDYKKDQCFVSDGGSVFALAGEDIVSVCKNRDDKGFSGKGLLEAAVLNGGRKLDSYEGNHAFYAKCGFEPVSWTKFNPEYAPDGALPEDIIFYKYTGNKRELDKAGVNKEIFDFKRSVEPMEYDAAGAYRDARLG